MSTDRHDSIARRMWVRFEPYHDVTYFTPESRAAADALGCRGGWMGYFGMRAAPLGAVGPDTVASAFYNFRPEMVARSVPDCWAIASPEEFLATRLAEADAALRRMLGEDVLTGPDVAEAASLAVDAARQAPTVDRWPRRTHAFPGRSPHIWRCGRRRHCCASHVAMVTWRRWSPAA